MEFVWKGVFPAVTTPFNDRDEIDLRVFNHNLQKQLEAGVNGFVLGGTLGEASTLEPEEKKSLIKSALEIADGRIPVIINIAEQSTKGAVQAVENAERLGVQGFMLLPPMRYKANDHETVQYLQTAARATGLPIMIYNNPVDYKIMVTLDMFEKLSEVKNINAVKESTRDVTNVTRMKNHFGERFNILCGVDTIAMEELILGADGWVAGLVDAFPAETVAIYRLVKAGRIEEATEIYRWFMPLLELDISPQLVQNIKLAEVATGLGTENVRAPRLPLAGDERRRVQSIIDHAMKNRPGLPDYLSLVS